MIANTRIRTTGSVYVLMTPREYSDIPSANISIINGTGAYSASGVTADLGIRPVISFSPNTFYSSGSGTMSDPYIIETNND